MLRISLALIRRQRAACVSAETTVLNNAKMLLSTNNNESLLGISKGARPSSIQKVASRARVEPVATASKVLSAELPFDNAASVVDYCRDSTKSWTANKISHALAGVAKFQKAGADFVHSTEYADVKRMLIVALLRDKSALRMRDAALILHRLCELPSPDLDLFDAWANRTVQGLSTAMTAANKSNSDDKTKAECVSVMEILNLGSKFAGEGWNSPSKLSRAVVAPATSPPDLVYKQLFQKYYNALIKDETVTNDFAHIETVRRGLAGTAVLAMRNSRSSLWPTSNASVTCFSRLTAVINECNAIIIQSVNINNVIAVVQSLAQAAMHELVYTVASALQQPKRLPRASLVLRHTNATHYAAVSANNVVSIKLSSLLRNSIRCISHLLGCLNVNFEPGPALSASGAQAALSALTQLLHVRFIMVSNIAANEEVAKLDAAIQQLSQLCLPPNAAARNLILDRARLFAQADSFDAMLQVLQHSWVTKYGEQLVSALSEVRAAADDLTSEVAAARSGWVPMLAILVSAPDFALLSQREPIRSALLAAAVVMSRRRTSTFLERRCLHSIVRLLPQLKQDHIWEQCNVYTQVSFSTQLSIIRDAFTEGNQLVPLVATLSRQLERKLSQQVFQAASLAVRAPGRGPLDPSRILRVVAEDMQDGGRISSRTKAVFLTALSEQPYETVRSWLRACTPQAGIMSTMRKPSSGSGIPFGGISDTDSSSDNEADGTRASGTWSGSESEGESDGSARTPSRARVLRAAYAVQQLYANDGLLEDCVIDGSTILLPLDMWLGLGLLTNYSAAEPAISKAPEHMPICEMLQSLREIATKRGKATVGPGADAFIAGFLVANFDDRQLRSFIHMLECRPQAQGDALPAMLRAGLTSSC